MAEAQGGENIDAVFAVTDDMVQCAMNALEANGLVLGQDVLTMGIDGTRAALESVEAGTQLASCTCTPYFGPIVVETITKLIILDEPTRGIDVGAKAEIEVLIQELSDAGMQSEVFQNLKIKVKK